MTKLLGATLVVLTACGAARPQAVATSTCGGTDQATSLFQIVKDNTPIPDLPSSNLHVFSNGAWRYQAFKHGEVLHTQAGCLAKPELATLREALAATSFDWKPGAASCSVMAMGFDEYRYLGKPVLRLQPCDPAPFDQTFATATSITNTIFASVATTRPITVSR
jgi:hypothetical protein